MAVWTRSTRSTAGATAAPLPGTVLPGVPMAPNTSTPVPAPRPPAGEVQIVVPAQPPAPPQPPALHTAPLQPPVPEAQPAVAPTPEAPVSNPPRPSQPAARTVLAGGPWATPDSSAWPAVVPDWGRPPAGFGEPGPGVGVVARDGSSVPLAHEDAEQLRAAARSILG